MQSITLLSSDNSNQTNLICVVLIYQRAAAVLKKAFWHQQDLSQAVVCQYLGIPTSQVFLVEYEWIEKVCKLEK